MGGVISPIITKPRFVQLFRPLVGTEDELADVLLMAASNRIRRRFADSGVLLVEADDEVQLVVYESVAAVLRHLDYAGLRSISFMTDDATEQRIFADALAQLDINDAQWRRLGLDSESVSASPRGCFPVGDY